MSEGEHLEVKFQRVWNFKKSSLAGGTDKNWNDPKAPFNLLVNLFITLLLTCNYLPLLQVGRRILREIYQKVMCGHCPTWNIGPRMM